MSLPLDGFVIGITADRKWQEQADLLERRGASVIHGPTMTTEYVPSDEALRQATQRVIDNPPGWLAATTGVGMRTWFEAAAEWGLGDALSSALGGARAVARGPKAATALQMAGIEPWATVPTERMEEVVTTLLAQPIAGTAVVVQDDGEDDASASSRLAAAGADVTRVPVYRWRLPADVTPARHLIAATCDGSVHAVTFTSAPAVKNMFTIAEEIARAADLRAAFDGGVLAACVGSVCAEAAVASGIEHPVFPAKGRLGLMIRVLTDALEGGRALPG